MISIIVPVYNVELFIRDCLDSIRNQTFRDWECILINDGSTDGSGSTCRRYCKQDPRFKYIYQKNSGVSAARNAGLDIARGEFISFVDPDDCIMDNFYSTMLDTLQKHSADIVSCATLSISEGDNYMNWSKGLKKVAALGIPFLITQENVIKGRDAIVMAIINEQIGMVCWDKLYKRDLWQNVRFPESITLGEDTAIIPEIVVKAKVFVIQQNAVYFYRKRSTSLSNSDLTWSRFKKNIGAQEQAATYLTGIVPGKEKAISEWTLKQNVMNLIGYSLKQERKGSILAKICEQAPAIEQYQGMDRIQTLKTVLGDVYRIMKGSEES